MLKELLVAGVSVPEVALKIGRASCRERVKFSDVATPFTAFTGALHVNIPLKGVVSMAISSARGQHVTALCDACTDVCVAELVIALLSCVVPGCAVNAGWVAGGGGAAVMLKELLVAGVSVPEVAL